MVWREGKAVGKVEIRIMATDESLDGFVGPLEYFEVLKLEDDAS